jgi:hypothetical protein
MCPDNGSQAAQQSARRVRAGERGGEVKVVEQQIGALGNPRSSFSSSSPLLCIRRGFDKNFTLGSAVHTCVHRMAKNSVCVFYAWKNLRRRQKFMSLVNI